MKYFPSLLIPPETFNSLFSWRNWSLLYTVDIGMPVSLATTTAVFGWLIIDVSIDHGGCFETSELTTHKNPVVNKHGVLHYGVPNIASRVARTSSFAVCSVISPILLRIGEEGGIKNLMRKDEGFRRGVYTFKSMMTNKTLSKMFDFPYKDLYLIISAL